MGSYTTPLLLPTKNKPQMRPKPGLFPAYLRPDLGKGESEACSIGSHYTNRAPQQGSKQLKTVARLRAHFLSFLRLSTWNMVGSYAGSKQDRPVPPSKEVLQGNQGFSEGLPYLGAWRSGTWLHFQFTGRRYCRMRSSDHLRCVSRHS